MPEHATGKVGPSWADVRDLMGGIQGSYGGFTVVHMAPAATSFGPPKTCWYAKWAPTLPHAHLAHYRGVSRFWPDREYRTVPEMLMGMLRTLDASLGREEEYRRLTRQLPLAQIVLPPLKLGDGNVTWDT
jgi:hypothetical protein